MSLPDLLTPEQVHALARDLNRIRGIDDALVAVDRSGNKGMAGLGQAVRTSIGPNAMPYFTDERLGAIVRHAVLNAMLHEREIVVAAVDGLAMAPLAPLAPTSLKQIWEMFE